MIHVHVNIYIIFYSEVMYHVVMNSCSIHEQGCNCFQSELCATQSLECQIF